MLRTTGFSLSEELFEELEKSRGPITRSKFIQLAVKKAIAEGLSEINSLKKSSGNDSDN
ncbi:MAG: hypothetical protein IBX72_14865 [Nitrospirae bacterium]|nr:hypothetical protein [Nitrospirota bacterium]MDW7725792.1 hypothetical protein [Candidatus Methanoperedens sp.]